LFQEPQRNLGLLATIEQETSFQGARTAAIALHGGRWT
jgi:hypothetical protein